MSVLVILLQVLTCVFGVASAYYWWKSAKVRMAPASKLPEVNDGALAFSVGENEHYVLDLPRQSELSAAGAIWAAFAMGCQVFSVLLTIFMGQS